MNKLAGEWREWFLYILISYFIIILYIKISNFTVDYTGWQSLVDQIRDIFFDEKAYALNF